MRCSPPDMSSLSWAVSITLASGNADFQVPSSALSTGQSRTAHGRKTPGFWRPSKESIEDGKGRLSRKLELAAGVLDAQG